MKFRAPSRLSHAWRKLFSAQFFDSIRLLIARIEHQALVRRLGGLGSGISIGLIAAGFVWICLPYIELRQLAYVSNIDAADCVYPQIASIVKMITQGQFSWWNPSQAGGTDTLGNFNSPILSVLAFVTLPPWMAFSILEMSPALLALASMYILLRSGLGVLPILAAFGGALYAVYLSIDVHVYLQPCGLILAAAPLVATWLLRVRHLSWATAAISIALGLLIALGGHYTWSLFVYVGIAALVFAFSENRFGNWIIHLAIIGTICFIVQLPFFLANLATAPFSSRVFGDVGDTYNLSTLVRLDWTLIVPNNQPHFVFMRAAYWLIPLLALVSFRLPKKAIIAAALYSALCVIDWALPYTLAHLSVAGYRIAPDGSWGGPFDFRFVALFGPLVAIVTLILVLDYPWRLRRGSEKNAAAGRPAVIVALCIILTIPFIWDQGYSRATQAYWVKINSRFAAQFGMNFVSDYGQPALKQLAQTRPDQSNYRVVTVAFDGDNPGHVGAGNPVPSLYGPFQNAYGFNIADGYASNFTGRYVRYWHRMLLGYDYRSLDYAKGYTARFTNFKWAFPQKLYLFEPIGPQRRKDHDCIDSPTGWRFADVYDLGMLSLANAEYIVSAFPLDEPRFTLLQSDFRQRQEKLLCADIGTKIKAMRGEALPPLPIYIYRNDDVIPRVFAPQHVKILDNADAELEAIRGKGAAVLRETAIISASDVAAANLKLSASQNIQINNTTLENDRVTVNIDTPTGGLLVVSNAYSPFWKASVDGVQAPIIPSYFTFQGIAVPPGSKKVTLRYCPAYVPFACR